MQQYLFCFSVFLFVPAGWSGLCFEKWSSFRLKLIKLIFLKTRIRQSDILFSVSKTIWLTGRFRDLLCSTKGLHLSKTRASRMTINEVSTVTMNKWDLPDAGLTASYKSTIGCISQTFFPEWWSLSWLPVLKQLHFQSPCRWHYGVVSISNGGVRAVFSSHGSGLDWGGIWVLWNSGEVFHDRIKWIQGIVVEVRQRMKRVFASFLFRNDHASEWDQAIILKIHNEATILTRVLWRKANSPCSSLHSESTFNTDSKYKKSSFHIVNYLNTFKKIC